MDSPDDQLLVFFSGSLFDWSRAWGLTSSDSLPSFLNSLLCHLYFFFSFFFLLFLFPLYFSLCLIYFLHKVVFLNIYHYYLSKIKNINVSYIFFWDKY